MAKNPQARALIKQLAIEARNRLKNANYGKQEETLKVKKPFSKTNSLTLIKNEHFNKNEVIIKIINDSVDEENFKRKVFELLDNYQDITNPLSKLVDHKKFDLFNDIQQEKYILELSDRYLKVREQYYNQCAI